MFNFLPIIVAAFIPILVGFIYYNPKVLGSAWMRELGKTEAELQEGSNMPLIMGASLLLSFFLSFGTNVVVELIHRNVDAAGEILTQSTHTLGHGMFHGLILAVLFVIPALVIDGLFERKSWKLLLINSGYWILTIMLMSGLLDVWN